MKMIVAQQRLIVVRKKQRKLKAEIDNLKAIIRSYGMEPEGRWPDQTKRNKQIVLLRKKGALYTAIGKKFNLSGTRVKTICQRYNLYKE